MWQVQLASFFVEPVSGVLVLGGVWWCLVGGEGPPSSVGGLSGVLVVGSGGGVRQAAGSGAGVGMRGPGRAPGPAFG